jgi:hypothetical protein
MADLELSSVNKTSKRTRIIRRVVELVTAAALLFIVLYWPRTHSGLLLLGAVAVIWFLGLRLLFKWPSV